MQEVYTLTWEDVDFEDQRVRLWTNKRKGGREFDWIPMTDDLLQCMRTQRLKTGFQEYVFINPRSGTHYKCHDHLMRRLCETAGVRRFGFHGIRHLSASILDNASVPLSAIQAILRHKSSHTTALPALALRHESSPERGVRRVQYPCECDPNEEGPGRWYFLGL
jgi:integrase